MSDGYQWQVSKDEPWIIIDWAGKRHEFQSQKDQLDFLERDQRMLHAAANEAKADVVTQINDHFSQPSGDIESEGEQQAVDASGEAEAQGTGVGSQGNRQSRRRSRRAANRKTTTR